MLLVSIMKPRYFLACLVSPSLSDFSTSRIFVEIKRQSSPISIRLSRVFG
jgi:hypothetical protein